MVKKRKGAIIRKVKDISISSALTLALLGGSALLQSCDDSEEGTTEESTEMVNEEVFTKSVQTHITEVSPRVFRITDEKVIEEEGKSTAVIKYLSGKVDTLTVEQAREIVEKQHQADSLRALASTQGIDSTKNMVVDTTKKTNGAAAKAYQNTRTNPSSSYATDQTTPVDHNYQQHGNYGTSSYNSSSHFDNSLGTMLMVGGMGYLMGSTVNNYRTRYLEDADRRSSSGSGGGYRGGTSRYYSNPATHAKTQSTHTNLKSSRTTVSRPASSRSGFFSRSGSSSSSSSKSSSGSSFSRSGSS